MFATCIWCPHMLEESLRSPGVELYADVICQAERNTGFQFLSSGEGASILTAEPFLWPQYTNLFYLCIHPFDYSLSITTDLATLGYLIPLINFQCIAIPLFYPLSWEYRQESLSPVES